MAGNSCTGTGFQSTHPVRGATVDVVEHGGVSGISIHAPREGCDRPDSRQERCHIISIHAPREGCDDAVEHARAELDISIHAPREGCDQGAIVQALAGKEFQSTHPVRGATRLTLLPVMAISFQSTHPVRGATFAIRFQQSCRTGISIHAPREGCD